MYTALLLLLLYYDTHRAGGDHTFHRNRSTGTIGVIIPPIIL